MYRICMPIKGPGPTQSILGPRSRIFCHEGGGEWTCTEFAYQIKAPGPTPSILGQCSRIFCHEGGGNPMHCDDAHWDIR